MYSIYRPYIALATRLARIIRMTSPTIRTWLEGAPPGDDQDAVESFAVIEAVLSIFAHDPERVYTSERTWSPCWRHTESWTGSGVTADRFRLIWLHSDVITAMHGWTGSMLTGVEPESVVAGPSRPAKARRKRNQGKAERCVGLYMDAVGRNETPPTPSELAREVGCNVATASRAIRKWEETRTAFAKKAASERRGLHNTLRNDD